MLEVYALIFDILPLDVEQNRNYLIYVALFSFLFLSIASSKFLWSFSKLGGSRTFITLWVCRLWFWGDKAFLASFCRKSFSIRGGNFAFVRFYWAALAILYFLTISYYLFLASRSTEQYQGIGLALNMNYYLSCFVFLLTFRFSKLKGFSFARVIIILLLFRSSFFFCC